MDSIVAYQFDGWFYIYAEKFHEALLYELNYIRVIDEGLSKYHSIVAKWKIKLKSVKK